MKRGKKQILLLSCVASLVLTFIPGSPVFALTLDNADNLTTGASNGTLHVISNTPILKLEDTDGIIKEIWEVGVNVDPPFDPKQNDDFLIWNQTQNVGIIIQSNGNVGIGTLSPGAALEVNGTVSASIFAGDGSGLTNLPETDPQVGTISHNRVPKWSNISQQLINGAIYDDGTSVGIGTTNPTSGTALDVIGIVKATSFLGSGSFLTNLPWSQLTGVPAGFADGIDDVGITVETDPVWTAAESSYGNLGQSEVILANWNNTANPWAVNEIDPSVMVTGENVSLLNNDAGYITASNVPGNETDPQVGANTTDFVPRWNGSSLVTGSIFDDGNEVGIGTSLPSGIFHVFGGQAGAGMSGTDITIEAQDGNGAGTAGGNIFLLPGIEGFAGLPGRVGIGTTTPGSALEVNGIVTGSFFSGDGSLLTNLPVNALATASLPCSSGQVAHFNGSIWACSSFTSLETDPIWTTAEPSYGNLGQPEVITANWDNTANPWAVNEIDPSVMVAGENVSLLNNDAGYLTSENDPIWTAAEPSYGNLGQSEVITANWNNTANPWAVNEIDPSVMVAGENVSLLNNDAGYLISETDPTVNALAKAPLSCTNGQVAAFIGANWICRGITSLETDPQVGANTANFVPRWNGLALITGSIFDDGNEVGIGTSTPSGILHVDGGTAGAGISGTSITLQAQDGGTGNTDGGDIVLTPGAGSGTGSQGLVTVNGTVSASAFASTSPLIFQAPAGTERMRIDDTTGSVGIGTTTPGSALDVNGTVTATAFAGDGSGLTNINESDPIWTAAEPGYGNLGQPEVIAANWDNTANPWAVNEIDSSVMVTGENVSLLNNDAGYLTSETDPVWTAAEPGYGNLGQPEVITANWNNTANPWAVNEIDPSVVVTGENVSLLNNDAGYITSETDPTVNALAKATLSCTIGQVPVFMGANNWICGPGGGFDSDWIISGSDMYSNVSGNIGIGTTTPIAGLHVEAGSVFAFDPGPGPSHGSVHIESARPFVSLVDTDDTTGKVVRWGLFDGDVIMSYDDDSINQDVDFYYVDLTNYTSPHFVFGNSDDFPTTIAATDQTILVNDFDAAGIKISSRDDSDHNSPPLESELVLEREGNANIDWSVLNDMDDNFYIQSSANDGSSWTDRVVIESTGNVGIGTTSPFYPLEMASGAHVTSGGVWTNASSREYKENIRELTAKKAAETLKSLNPVEFNYKVDNKEDYIGFIAEDVPEAVATNDRKGLSPMDIVAVLTKVVQDQQKINQEQQRTIAELKEEMKEIKREMKLKGSIASVMN